MLTLEESIQQLNQFLILRSVVRRMERLKNKTAITDTYVMFLRNELMTYFNKPDANRYIRCYLSLKQVTHNALLVLAALKPVNGNVSLEALQSGRNVVFSTGYVYDFSLVAKAHDFCIKKGLPFIDITTKDRYSLYDRVAFLGVAEMKNPQTLLTAEEAQALQYKKNAEQHYNAISPLVAFPRRENLPVNKQRDIRNIEIITTNLNGTDSVTRYKRSQYQKKIGNILKEHHLKIIADRAFKRAEYLMNITPLERGELLSAWRIAYEEALRADKLTKENYEFFTKLSQLFILGLLLAAIPLIISGNIDSDSKISSYIALSIYACTLARLLWRIYDYYKTGNEEFTKVNNRVLKSQDVRLTALRLQHNPRCGFFRSSQPITLDVEHKEESDLEMTLV